MPIYEFNCKKCSGLFEKLTSFNWQEAGVECPECGSKEIERVVSLVGRFNAGGPMKSADNGGGAGMPASSSACAGCVGKSCSTCH